MLERYFLHIIRYVKPILYSLSKHIRNMLFDVSLLPLSYKPISNIFNKVYFSKRIPIVGAYSIGIKSLARKFRPRNLKSHQRDIYFKGYLISIQMRPNEISIAYSLRVARENKLVLFPPKLGSRSGPVKFTRPFRVAEHLSELNFFASLFRARSPRASEQ